MACDHIDFNMIVIIIIVYIQNVQYLTLYKSMTDNVAISKATFVLGGHMTKCDWYIHTLTHECVIKKSQV